MREFSADGAGRDWDLERSRVALLDEIGQDHDLTLVHGPGVLGDDLILAGARALLGGRVYREIDAGELASTSGDVALLCAGGAWCRPYHEWAPRALALAEMRFRRVIVLPASFDVGDDQVRDALQRSAATVFAREHESFERISGLCHAKLAHDCAFFFDYEPYLSDGAGTLNAFRTDHEALDGELLAPGNDDVSVTAGSLDAFLRTIAGHELIRTDRAHVMIAGALLGKRVEFAAGSYFKVPALAASWLRDYPVTQIEPPRADAMQPASQPVSEPTDRSAAAAAEARVTVAILTRDRRRVVADVVRSVLRSGVALRVLVIGNNPDEQSRAALAALATTDPRVELRVLDRNLGCGGGRRLACELADTEFVMFLDDDAELGDGALERLVADLDAHPEAVGVTPLVVDRAGVVLHCGGTMERTDDTVAFRLGGCDRTPDDPAVPGTGSSDWLPGTAALIRAHALRAVPIDADAGAYYEDNDWSFRVAAQFTDPFRRCREAVVVHDNRDWTASHTCELARISWAAERLAATARFLDRHGLLLDVDLTALVPELAGAGGSIDIRAARLLLELVLANGTDWLVAEWMGGGLEPLLGRRTALERAAVEHEQLRSAHEQLRTQHDELRSVSEFLFERHRTLERVENGGWWRLRTRIELAIRLADAARRTARGR